ncbi:hypothetical protein IQ264_13880 [Phormidium sp. LEGE 05292]|uniref:hypothetical protein n=1 Tax=[Phormidium] sp. LEGE 05292 TaxID=767427 RepID=UPI00187F64DC|nr:hypothetical protein [Phormidium sp. LEGE 05292]MBE9226513.1 hypothetical protein [Phormidium sp. LEGE 05292]
MFLITLLITISSSLTLPKPAFAFPYPNFSLLKQLDKILSNKQMVADTKKLLDKTPETICKAYFDKLKGIDNSKWAAIEEGLASTGTIATAIASASNAGAGALAGYAGIASAVSELGLGGIMTTIAGMMGSNVAGAAATAVVTSAVGGPAVMGVLIAGGTSGSLFLVYKLGKFTVEKLENLAQVEKLEDWAKSYCLSR